MLSLSASRLAILTLVFAVGCTLSPTDEQDESYARGDDPELSYAECTSGRCRGAVTRATPEQEAISAKRQSLDAFTQQTYFHHPLDNIGTTQDGTPFQFWADELEQNLGAIYVVAGTAIAIKGPFLAEWARCGYENAPLMGYPRGDELNGRQEFEAQWVVPEVENNGLAERRHYLVYEGDTVHHVFENRYLDSNLPKGQLSTQPQQCDVIDFSALEGTALAVLLDDPKYGGTIPTLWCGAPPGPWVPPQNAEWGDI